MKKQTLTIIIAAIVSALSPASAETFATWVDDMFDPEESALTDPNADPDGDGMNNLLEYALDGDPLYADAIDVLPTPVIENGRLVLRFKRDTARADVTLEVLKSTDLKVWSSVDSVVESVRKAIERRAVTADLEGRAFFRFRASNS